MADKSPRVVAPLPESVFHMKPATADARMGSAQYAEKVVGARKEQMVLG